MTATAGRGCSVCGSAGFDLECPACVVVVQATAVAHGLPQLATAGEADPVPGVDEGASAMSSVLATYGRLVGELVEQVADWRRASDRYAATVSRSLEELRSVLADLAAGQDGAR